MEVHENLRPQLIELEVFECFVAGDLGLETTPLFKAALDVLARKQLAVVRHEELKLIVAPLSELHLVTCHSARLQSKGRTDREIPIEVKALQPLYVLRLDAVDRQEGVACDSGHLVECAHVHELLHTKRKAISEILHGTNAGGHRGRRIPLP